MPLWSWQKINWEECVCACVFMDSTPGRGVCCVCRRKRRKEMPYPLERSHQRFQKSNHITVGENKQSRITVAATVDQCPALSHPAQSIVWNILRHTRCPRCTQYSENKLKLETDEESTRQDLSGEPQRFYFGSTRRCVETVWSSREERHRSPWKHHPELQNTHTELVGDSEYPGELQNTYTELVGDSQHSAEQQNTYTELVRIASILQNYTIHTLS